MEIGHQYYRGIGQILYMYSTNTFEELHWKYGGIGTVLWAEVEKVVQPVNLVDRK